MTIRNMAKLNMANMNTLFRKGYLLAGVIMAANIFVVNEVRASSRRTISTNGKGQPLPNIDIKKLILLKNNKNPRTILNLNTFNNGKEEGRGIEKRKIIERGEEKDTGKENSCMQGFLDFLLSWENAINFIGTLAFSSFNNYTKWWDYNPGTYCKFVWSGWRSIKGF